LAQKLGIPEKPATKAALNKIFKDLSKKYHPDRGGDPEKMKQLTEWQGYWKNKVAVYHPQFQEGFIAEMSKLASF
jgi:curved DNA-binding protein CbpA